MSAPYLAYVEKTENNETAVVFQKTLLDKLNLKAGQYLVWQEVPNKPGSWMVTVREEALLLGIETSL